MGSRKEVIYSAALMVLLAIGGVLWSGCSKKPEPQPPKSEETPASFVFGGIKESVSNLGK